MKEKGRSRDDPRSALNTEKSGMTGLYDIKQDCYFIVCNPVFSKRCSVLIEIPSRGMLTNRNRAVKKSLQSESLSKLQLQKPQ